MRRFLIIFGIALLLGVASLAISRNWAQAQAAPRDPGVWALLRIDQKGTVLTFNGLIERTDFDGLTGGRPKPFVLVKDVFFRKGDGFGYQDIEHRINGSGPSIWVKSDLILQMCPLIDEYVKRARSKEERDKAFAKQRDPQAVPVSGPQGLQGP
jgi:hypothetical protein